MDFHRIRLEDKDWILDRLAVDRFYGAEYCFSSMFHWQDYYQTTLARFENFAVLRSGTQKAYCYFGDGDRSRLFSALEQEAERREEEFCLYSVMEKEKNRIEQLFPSCYSFTESRDSFDYCYTQEKLAELKGRKLSSKRNHVNKFLSTYPTWSYEEMDESNIPACKVMGENWYRHRLETLGEDLSHEKQAIFTAMDHFHEERLIGGVLKVDGQVVAFTMGYPVRSDVIVVHFEKANPEYVGCYQMINQQFAKQSCQAFRLMNREEDMGHENLRKSKESYLPDDLLVKYRVTKKQ